MILVVLGTQDKTFPRLVQAIDEALEKGEIKDKVVVQAGQTKYESKNMEIFDFLPAPEFEKLMDEADIIITHGGAGSILSAIQKNKKIIAAPRLAKYKEHHNDHQKQIIGEFVRQGYLLELEDFSKIGEMIEKCKKFKPKKFQSNTKNMISLLENYIDQNHISWYNKSREVLSYLFFGVCTTFVNIFTFWILRMFLVSLLISNMIAWILSVLFAFITNKVFVFESKGKNVFQEGISFFGFRLFSLVMDMGLMYLLVEVLSSNEMLSKVITNVFVIVINYVFSKLFIFKK